MTQMMARPNERLIINFPSARAKNTYIEVEWLITSDLNKRPDHGIKQMGERPSLTEPEQNFTDLEEANARIAELRGYLDNEQKGREEKLAKAA